MTLYCGNYEALEILITLYGLCSFMFGSITGYLIFQYKFIKGSKGK